MTDAKAINTIAEFMDWRLAKGYKFSSGYGINVVTDTGSWPADRLLDSYDALVPVIRMMNDVVYEAADNRLDGKMAQLWTHEPKAIAHAIAEALVETKGVAKSGSLS